MILLTLAPALVPAAAHAQAYEHRGPHAVQVVLETWQDGARKRSIPVKRYVPGGNGPFPVILFSHGLGGSREGGAQWGAHWASHGYIAVHLQHAGSDEQIWRGKSAQDVRAALRSGMSARQLRARMIDVRFVLEEMARRQKAGDPAWAAADLSRIGMSGHSFGARTTLALAGERFPNWGSRPEARIAAAIAFSPAAGGAPGAYAQRFGAIAMPFMSITGTADRDVMDNGSTPQNRREPFVNMPPPDKYLLVLKGANHAVFNGQPGRSGLEPDREAVIVRQVMAASTAFWDAHLKRDALARTWLAQGGFAGALDGEGEFHVR